MSLTHGSVDHSAMLASVIVATRNRPVQLRTCLAALAAQRFDHARFEVIVVDDGGEASLEVVVAEFEPQLHLRLLVQEHAGPARARNAGAAVASGTLLAFTDDDCEPASDWLIRLYAAFECDRESALGGRTVNALPDNPYSTASQLLIDYLYAYHSRIASAGQAPAAPPFFTSNNLAMPAARFRDVGGLDETFPLAAGEDRELCDRWLYHGYRLRTVPDAVIRHSHHLSLRLFWRQHVNYGRGTRHLRRARLAKGRHPLRAEPMSFYLRLIVFPLRNASRRRPQLVALMALSQVATVLGFLLEAARRPRALHHAPSTWRGTLTGL